MIYRVMRTEEPSRDISPQIAYVEFDDATGMWAHRRADLSLIKTFEARPTAADFRAWAGRWRRYWLEVTTDPDEELPQDPDLMVDEGL